MACIHALELQLRLASWKDPAVDVGIVVSELNIFGEHFHKTNPLVNFLSGWLRAVLAIEVTVGQLLPRQIITLLVRILPPLLKNHLFSL